MACQVIREVLREDTHSDVSAPSSKARFPASGSDLEVPVPADAAVRLAMTDFRVRERAT